MNCHIQLLLFGTKNNPRVYTQNTVGTWSAEKIRKTLRRSLWSIIKLKFVIETFSVQKAMMKDAKIVTFKF